MKEGFIGSFDRRSLNLKLNNGSLAICRLLSKGATLLKIQLA